MKYPNWTAPPEQEHDPWIKRPIVPVTLAKPLRSLALTALVDSGSDYSLFHVDVEEALGIDLSHCEKREVSGIEYDPAPYYLTEDTATVEHLEPVAIPVMFWDRQPFALIGQVGFFDRHTITFARDRDTFEITPVRSHSGEKGRAIEG